MGNVGGKCDENAQMQIPQMVVSMVSMNTRPMAASAYPHGIIQSFRILFQNGYKNVITISVNLTSEVALPAWTDEPDLMLCNNVVGYIA